MSVSKKVFEAGSFARQKAKIKLRYPIQKVTVVGGAEVKESVKQLADVIAKQLNSKQVEYAPELSGAGYVALPNFKVLGPKFGKEAAKVAEAIKADPAKAKEIFDSGKDGLLGGFNVSADMISEVRMVVPEKYSAEAFSADGINGVVYIDTERSDSLINEALARELIRNIQQLRKKHEMAELDRIKVALSGGAKTAAALKEFEQLILDETRADEVVALSGEGEASFTFEDEEVSIRIK